MRPLYTPLIDKKYISYQTFYCYHTDNESQDSDMITVSEYDINAIKKISCIWCCFLFLFILGIILLSVFIK